MISCNVDCRYCCRSRLIYCYLTLFQRLSLETFTVWGRLLAPLPEFCFVCPRALNRFIGVPISISVAPNNLDRHPVLLSSHFPSSVQCYISKGRFSEYISVVPIYSCTRSSHEGEFRSILNPFQRVPVALTFLCAERFTRVPFQCTQLPVAFMFRSNTYPTGVILLCTAVLLHFSGV